jgi:hypothetical protein
MDARPLLGAVALIDLTTVAPAASVNAPGIIRSLSVMPDVAPAAMSAL